MSRVMEAWQQVLSEAVSSDYDKQQFALFQIGFVLQRHNPHLTMDSDAEDETLSRNLLRLTLNEQKQQDTVNYLVSLIHKHTAQADLFLYALNNAQPKLVVEPLLKLLVAVGNKLRPHAAYQALLAIDNILKLTGDTYKSLFDTNYIIPTLDDWSDLKDDLIAKKADSVADKIIDMLNNGDA